MENIQRTIYASYLQTCLILQQPIIYPSFSTLNEKFNIGVDKIVSPTTYPKVQYAVIGNGGHKMQVDSTGFYVPVPAQHEATDACLFNHIPFVLREIDDDLTDDEIANYRLRIPVVYNNITYIAYYAKILDMSEATPALISKSIASGTVTSSPYTTTVNNLDPKPVDLTTVAANLVNNNYVGTLSLAKLTLTANDVTEILNAANIIYGNPNKAIISEIGICSGIDIDNQSTINGYSRGYTEGIRMQINTFDNTFYPMSFINNGLSVTYNVGATEPLLDLTTQ